MIRYHVETERESDGRWIAEVPVLPGVMTYGSTQREALEKVADLAWKVVLERARNGEPVPGAVLAGMGR